MIRRDLGKVLRTIDGFKDVKLHPLFADAMFKNRALILETIKGTETVQPPEKQKEYTARRLELCVEFSEKTESGEAIIENEDYVIVEDKRKEFDAVIEKLRIEFADTVKEFEEFQKQINILASEKLEIPFIRVPLTVFPGVTLQERALLEEFIELENQPIQE